MSLSSMKRAVRHGLHARVAGWERRLRRSDIDAEFAEAQDRYARFVRDFGPAGGLPDGQLGALVAYCADATDGWPPTVAAELLHGRADLDEEFLEPEHPRVLAVTQRRGEDVEQ